MEKLKYSDILALGFMAFALFVGAGNIILPPFIGLNAGDNVWTAAIGFLIPGVGLPVITLVAMAYIGGSISVLTSPIGKVGGTILTVACYLCIGPMFAGPRTATVSFETGILPFLTKDENGVASAEHLALFLYSLVFFIIVTWVSLYPTKLLQTVGKVLAPIKILALAILGIAAFLEPAGITVAASNDYNSSQASFSQGIINGYMTLDTLAAMAFGIIIIDAIRSRGIKSTKLQTRYAIIAALIAGLGLTLVYICLFKLGSNSGELIGHFDNGAKVLQAYVNHTFGQFGAMFLAILIGLACLVTAIGVTTASSEYLSKLFSIPYKWVMLVVAVVSFIVSNVGLTELLTISVPVLFVIYPPCIVIVLMSFINKIWNNSSNVYVPVTLVALFFGIFDGFRVSGIPVPEFISRLPLSELSIPWLVPSVIVLIIATIWDRIKKPAA